MKIFFQIKFWKRYLGIIAFKEEVNELSRLNTKLTFSMPFSQFFLLCSVSQPFCNLAQTLLKISRRIIPTTKTPPYNIWKNIFLYSPLTEWQNSEFLICRYYTERKKEMSFHPMLMKSALTSRKKRLKLTLSLLRARWFILASDVFSARKLDVDTAIKQIVVSRVIRILTRNGFSRITLCPLLIRRFTNTFLRKKKFYTHIRNKQKCMKHGNYVLTFSVTQLRTGSTSNLLNFSNFSCLHTNHKLLIMFHFGSSSKKLSANILQKYINI